MDSTIRVQLVARSQTLAGLLSPAVPATRRSRDERVDVPEIESSARVSFSGGVAVQPGCPVRGGTDRYRIMADDAMRQAGGDQRVEDQVT